MTAKSADKSVTLNGVTWNSSPEYNPNKAGTYIFTAVLPTGYALSDGVALPTITVKVAEKSSNKPGNSTKNKSTVEAKKEQTETKVDTSTNTSIVTTKPDDVTTNGDTASITATVPTITIDNTNTPTNGSVLDTAQKATVTINVPTEAIKQQLTAKKDVELTMMVLSTVARDTNPNVALSIIAGKDIFETAKQTLSDVTIKIKDADTQQLAYSWTFKGEDLAKSNVPVTDVNIAMSVRKTEEIPKIHEVTQGKSGVVLSFNHSGTLPAVASVTISVLEKGYQPGQTLYFYYYNPTTGQIEPVGTDAYTVDAQGNVTVQITHCSDYVLLPKPARSLTLDTTSYEMPLGGSYEIGIKLVDAQDTTLKVYSSTKGVADVIKLKNGNYKVIGKKPGLTYIMFDVYDKKGNRIVQSHASVRLTVKKGTIPNGDSHRQTAIF